MAKLTLVRHAKSAWRLGALDDFSRPLNKRGLRDCLRVPRLLAEHLPPPDRIVCSDAARAVQTCQALIDAFDLPGDAVQIEHRLYLADAPDIVKLLRKTPARCEHLLVVGHNPGLTDVYNQLCGASLDNLPTFGAAHLDLGGGWTGLGAGRASPLSLLFPKDL